MARVCQGAHGEPLARGLERHQQTGGHDHPLPRRIRLHPGRPLRDRHGRRRRDRQIAWIGGDDAAAVHVDAVDEVVELDGALVTPAFVDAHAHTVTDRRRACAGSTCATPSRWSEALSRIEDAARRKPGPPALRPSTGTRPAGPSAAPHTAAELDRATYGGVVYSPRVDGHSAVISSALAAACGARDLPGWEGDGLVTRDAHHAAREAFNGAVTPAQRQRSHIDLALRPAAAAGHRAGPGERRPHPLRAPTTSPRSWRRGSAATARRRSATGPSWSPTRPRPATLATLRGARGLAGDLNIDGSIGSRTAHLRADYADAPATRATPT